MKMNESRGQASCSCQETSHPVQLIVLTGGPGAGKTAVLELVRKTLCEHVVIVPEAASIIFSGGFWRHETTAGEKGAQRAIYHVQRELEGIIEEEGTAALALCDRGTLDSLAYWPVEEEIFWKEVESNRQNELIRYKAVIQLRSPSLEEGYNHQNPLRIESVRQAHLIDQKLLKIWEGHPNRHIIENEPDFMTKAHKAIQILKQYLPKCCHLEKLP